MKMVKVFSLVLMLGLALSPARAEEEGKEGEEEIELTEGGEEAPEEELKDLDAVEKEAKKVAGDSKDPKLRGWSSSGSMSRTITWGSRTVKKMCGCGGVTQSGDWERVWNDIHAHVKKDDEMVLTFKCSDGVHYKFKSKSDKTHIYYSQQRHGRWKEWTKIPIEDIDKYFPFSVIQWTDNDGQHLFGIVRGTTIVAWQKTEAMPYVINRMILDWFMHKVITEHSKTVTSYEIEWKGKQFTYWPRDQPEYLLKPYFLPEKYRRVYWVIVKKSNGVAVIPRPPTPIKHEIHWPDFKLPSREVSILPDVPDSFFMTLCWYDDKRKICRESGSSPHGGSSDDDSGSMSTGPGSRETGGESVIFGPIPHGGNIRIIPMEHSTETHHGKSCQCQKRCSCTMHKQRKKRSTANSYKEFLELTADCVSERRCRRAYSKFLKNGVIKVKSD